MPDMEAKTTGDQKMKKIAKSPENTPTTPSAAEYLTFVAEGGDGGIEVQSSPGTILMNSLSVSVRFAPPNVGFTKKLLISI